jgi:hypothetical protein
MRATVFQRALFTSRRYLDAALGGFLRLDESRSRLAKVWVKGDVFDALDSSSFAGHGSDDESLFEPDVILEVRGRTERGKL